MQRNKAESFDRSRKRLPNMRWIINFKNINDMKLVKTFFIAWLMTMIWGGVCYAQAKVGDIITGKKTKEGVELQYVITDTVSTQRKVGVISYTSHSKTAVTIPDTIRTSISPDTTYFVTTIEEKAFNDYNGLKTVTLSNSIDTIKTYAFKGCSSLETVIIGSSSNLKVIGDSAFYSASKLAGFTAQNTFTIPGTVTKIGRYAFGKCDKLEKIIITSKVDSIGEHAFASCSNLEKVTIDPGIKIIDSCAFMDCFELKEVTIPSSVTTIRAKAFYDCDKIQKVTVSWSSLANLTTDNNIFDEIDRIDTVRLIITGSDIGIYTAGPPWDQFLIPQRTITNKSNVVISAISLPSQAATDSVYLKSNTKWRISGKPTWLTVTPADATSSTLNAPDSLWIKLSAVANDLTEDRTATLTIEGGDAPTKTLTVTQSKVPVNTSNINLSSLATKCTIPVNAGTGVSWTVNVSYSGSSSNWITGITLPFSGTGNGAVVFYVAENKGSYTRSAIVKITISGKEYPVAVIQQGESFGISKTSLNFSIDGGKDTIKIVSTEHGWTVTPSASWLTVSPSSGSWNNDIQNIIVTAERNGTVATREAKIVFKGTGAGSNDSIVAKVTQSGATASLTYAPTPLKIFSSKGDTTAITVTANVNWTVEIASAADRIWLSVDKSEGSGNGKIIIQAIPNTQSASRSGKITIKGGSGITREITVTQSRVTIAPDSIVIPKTLWVRPGEYKSISAYLYPAEADNREATWSVENGAIVRLVDSNLTCMVIGVAEGSTNIYVFTKEGLKMAVCRVTVSQKEPSAIEPVESAAPYVTVDDSKLLLVNTPVAEQITIYSAGGALLMQSQKAAGPATFDIRRLPAGVLIVKGGSGWTEKIAVQ
jgi:hypothetical protein